MWSVGDYKVVVIIIMFAVPFALAMSPVKLVTWNKHKRQPNRWRRLLLKAISLANCFSGGVFFGACLLDVFPDTEESMNLVLDQIKERFNIRIDFPVDKFASAVGVLLVLTVEQSVLWFKEQGTTSSDPEQPKETDALLPIGVADSNSTYGTTDMPHSPDLVKHNHEEDHDHTAMFEHSAFRSMMLLLALTFHSFFEGLEIGLQQENGQLIQIFMVVMLHKGIMAFSLGLNLAQAHGMTVKYFITASLIFSLASPTGMAVGIVISDLKDSLSKDVATAILQGIAGGTFLYITCLEVLPHEFASGKMRLQKVISVTFGFLLIAGIIFFTN